jgi:hypothetical protein
MTTLMDPRSLKREESLHAYPTLRAAAGFLGVAPSTLSRRADLRSLSRGERDQVLMPEEVMRLAVVYRKRSLNEVAADLIDHAARSGADEAERTEAAVEAFFEARTQRDSAEEFLAQARRHLPVDLYAEVERTVRAGQGRRPKDIVGGIPQLVDEAAAKKAPATTPTRTRKQQTTANRTTSSATRKGRGSNTTRKASTGSRSKTAAPARARTTRADAS